MTIDQAFELALAHHQAGRLAQAETIYRQILAAAPHHGDTLHLLGVMAHQVGRSAEAVPLIEHACALIPHVPAVHSNLGEAYRNLGRLDEAIAAYRRAIQIQPDFADARMNLGVALVGLGRPDEAIAEYARALRIAPASPAIRFNLGLALSEAGRFVEAIDAYREALRLQPDFHGALVNLGVALTKEGRQDEAVACFQEAITLQPQAPEAHINLGTARATQGLAEEAIEAFRSALRLNPHVAWVHSNLLGAQNTQANADPEEVFREHCRWDENHARPLGRHAEPHANLPAPERRLRIGYVSADFREHPVAVFLETLLAAHDPGVVEVFCYSNVARKDAVTARFARPASVWRDIAKLDDLEVVEMIRRDRIDILVDLGGHTTGNRLLVFARKPAPLQVTYLGYCNTTGMQAMDYRFTDSRADPPGMTEHLHTEQLIRLPDCAWCFTPASDAGPVGNLPAAPAGTVTFGSFNALSKVTGEMLRLWAEILGTIPGSRLLLKNAGYQNPSVQARVRAVFERAGIDPARIEMTGRVPAAEHWSYYRRLDVALDTFPYHGTTTTCEALWMGVPLVTLAGRTHASRVGVSLLNTIGLSELVAHTAEDYVRLAVELAGNPPRLTQLRATLRERVAASPLMDGPRFARHIEAAYRQMWRTWCAQKPPMAPS